VARAIEAALLPEATGLSRARLRKRAQQLLLEHAPQAREDTRRRDAARADVHTDPSHLEGMTRLSVDLPTAEGAACYDLVNQLARMLKADGDPRPIGVLRAAVLSLLIRRPWQHTPSVTARLTVSTPLAALTGHTDEAGEVDGLAITAAHLRDLLRQLDALGLRAPAGGSLTLAITSEDGALLGTLGLAELQRLVRRGAGLSPPPATESYRPTAAQRVFVSTRDRTCRFPNCGQRVGWADLDHVLAHACGGETPCTNLRFLCRRHHPLKTMDPTWRFVLDHHGTPPAHPPSGITRTTRPPGLHPRRPAPPDAEPSPPADPDAEPPF